MALNHVRRLVSGSKARFVDHETAVDLDLVYVTDRIIIMGYPATGAAALYRNKRADVLRFINSRHGEKWWIWNLCPLYENAYSPESMHNRVSRYPFPDHHPPPLPLLPLAVREMTAWLEGDEERVAIIHCKAGKGRSGTLLCSYLLSLSELPPAPQLDRSHSHREVARPGVTTQTDSSGPASTSDSADLGREDEAATPARSERIQLGSTSATSSSSALSSSTSDNVAGPSKMYLPMAIGDEDAPGSMGQEDRADGKVDGVMEFHSSRRMKATSKGRGVSIPSQRRWCRYINLVLSNKAPQSYTSGSSRIRLLSVTYLLKPPSTWQKPFVPLVVGGGSTGQGKAFASVARYDDDYVAELNRRGGTGQGIEGEITWGGVGGEGIYDNDKMFRKCGKLVPAELDEEIRAFLPPSYEDYIIHHLEPNTPSLILDRAREFRLKFQLGSMPLGWAWLIPAFHLPEPEPGPHPQRHTLYFPRSQLDFPLGPGASVYQILVRLQEVPDEEACPARLMDEEEEKREGVYESRAGSMLEESE